MKKETDDEHIQNGLKDIVERILGTRDKTGEFKENDIIENQNMALISYFIPPMPFIVERSSKYVKYHSNQGMNNLAWALLLLLFMWIVDVAFAWEHFIRTIRIIIGLVYIGLSAAGVYNVHEKKARDLPFVGKFNIIDKITDLFTK